MLALESVDLSLGRLLVAVKRAGGIALVTADHGNSDQMYELGKQGEILTDKQGRPRVRTAHSLNPVPFSVVDSGDGRDHELDPTVEAPGLSNVAATALWLMGYQAPPDYDPPLVRRRQG
jgi:2,3-bisphosphoglycerate-independent phosphoglycerate mutase